MKAKPKTTRRRVRVTATSENAKLTVEARIELKGLVKREIDQVVISIENTLARLVEMSYLGSSVVFNRRNIKIR